MGDPVSLCLIALCVGIALLRKDGIRSLEFSRKHAKASIITGLVLGILIAVCHAAVGIVQGAGRLAPVGMLLPKLLYYLCIISFGANRIGYAPLF